MGKISFSDFDLSGNGSLSFVTKSEGESSDISFGMPAGFVPANDLIGVALTTLVGSNYSSLEIDLPLSPLTQDSMASLTNAEILAPDSNQSPSLPSGVGIGLNFSGGFDSLAAKIVLPDSAKLIALDFGGPFAREEEFFRKFFPTVISTNFREKGFSRNSWSFMGIGPILLRDYLEIDSYSFGTILEASTYNFVDELKFKNVPNPWFSAAGLSQVNPVLGLTEVGTAMLLLHHQPELIKDSLNSLAAPTSEKYARKVLLLELAQQAISKNFGIRLDNRENGPFFKFGHSFAVDFLIFYVLKKGGKEMASLLVSDIPDSVHKLVSESSMDFYERVNTNFYNSMRPEYSSRVFAKCFEAGIGIYDQRDWSEFGKVKSILRQYHKFPG